MKSSSWDFENITSGTFEGVGEGEGLDLIFQLGRDFLEKLDIWGDLW
jgi:hypothetical protein